MKKPIVFDIDGTLTSESYDESNLRTLKENPTMVILALALQNDQRLLISTARPEYLREDTEYWLSSHGIEPTHIYMRPNHMEGVPDFMIKEEHLDDILERYAPPQAWVDDNDENCEMLKKRGIPVIHVKQ